MMSADDEKPKPRKRKIKDLRFDAMALGYRFESSGIGFSQRHTEPPPIKDDVFHRGDEHALVFAPTGKGKGVSLLIPTLLTYTGPAIVVDIKGEAAQVTAQRRRDMGQKVFVIDPFRVTTNTPDKFNPLDLHLINSCGADVDAEMFATMLSTGKRGEDTYWLDTATPLVAGAIAHHLTANENQDRNFNTVRKFIRDDEFDYTLAKLLDDKKVSSRFAHEEFATYLQICSDRTRPCVLSTARSFLRSLCSDAVADSLESTSFDWKELLGGEPMTIYFVIPPSKLASHQALIRLWIGSLMLGLSTRCKHHGQRTLLLLDEAAQLSQLEILKTLFTLMRGYGVQVVAFYQDLSQIMEIFPRDWETIINNAGVLAAFGLSNFRMANRWSEYFGMDPAELLRIDRQNMAIWTPNEGAQILRRLNYLTDPRYQGLFDPNPRFEK
jgi:type IV secretion system protein VirD4